MMDYLKLKELIVGSFKFSEKDEEKDFRQFVDYLYYSGLVKIWNSVGINRGDNIEYKEAVTLLFGVDLIFRRHCDHARACKLIRQLRRFQNQDIWWRFEKSVMVEFRDGSISICESQELPDWHKEDEFAEIHPIFPFVKEVRRLKNEVFVDS